MTISGRNLKSNGLKKIIDSELGFSLAKSHLSTILNENGRKFSIKCNEYWIACLIYLRYSSHDSQPFDHWLIVVAEGNCKMPDFPVNFT